MADAGPIGAVISGMAASTSVVVREVNTCYPLGCGNERRLSRPPLPHLSNDQPA